MRRRVALFVLVACGCLATASPIAQVRRPAAVATLAPSGVSVERLGRIDTLVGRYVDEQRIAGAVTLVMKKGTPVHFKAYGMADREQKTAMKTDTIFRIASMSKAVTSVAIMTLVDNGDLLLSDPVSKFIPAFEKTFVAPPGHAPRPAHALARSPPGAGSPSATCSRTRRESRMAAGCSMPSTRPPGSTRGTSRARPSRWRRSSTGSRRCRSTRSPANGSCTATTPTSSAG